MSASGAAENPQRSATRTFPRKFFGVIAIVHAILVVAQPILAGLSLEGNSGALDLHYTNGMLIMGVAFLQVIAAVLWWKPGGGPSKAMSVSAVLLVAEVAQFFIGDSGNFAIHLPLGILVFFGALAAAGMAYSKRRESDVLDA